MASDAKRPGETLARAVKSHSVWRLAGCILVKPTQISEGLSGGRCYRRMGRDYPPAIQEGSG
jgi:hypothetical protein